MKIIKAIKTKLAPNKTQFQQLCRYGGLSRYIYNWALAERTRSYREEGKNLSWPEQGRRLTQLKKENPWMYEISKFVGEDAIKRVDLAFQRFFKRVALKKQGKLPKGEKLGYPRFKSKARKNDSFTFTSGARVENKKYVVFPKLGRIKTFGGIEHLEGQKINRATISRRRDEWYLSLIVEEEIEVPIHQGPPIGVDVGIKSLVTLSNGIQIENIRSLTTHEAKLKRLSRQVSRKKKGSANRRKAIEKLNKFHEKIANIRSNYTHQVSNILTRDYSFISLEDLNIKGMIKNHKLAKQLADVNFGELKRQIQYKATWRGGSTLEVNQWYPSSKTCSNCGKIKEELNLSERIFRCACGFVEDRDINASINILREGLRAKQEQEAQITI